MKKVLDYLKYVGFKKVKVPSGIKPNTINRWICNKVPYSSAISEFRIEEIVKIAKKEVFDDIDEIFHLNDTKAIRLYTECNCCSRFVKKLSEVKKRNLRL